MTRFPLVAHTAPPPTATWNTGCGSSSVPPSEIDRSIASSFGSMRTRVPSFPFATHTEPKPAAMSLTSPPIPIVLTTFLVFGSM
jgi:hypothetical protein